MVGFLLLGGLYAAFIYRWRWGIYGMIIFFPVSGLVTLFFFPAPLWTRLVKDILFVLPVYAGFFLWGIQNPAKLISVLRDLPILPIALLALLVGIQFFNPALPNRMVGLIGVRTWLFYLPMLGLGYQLVSSKQQLLTLAKVMLIVALIPCIFGIGQAVLYYTGEHELAYAIYGAAASDVSQGFTSFGDAGSNFGLVRLPSLFTYVTQYLLFLLSMLPIAYFMAFRPNRKRGPRVGYILILGTILIAGFASGARGAFAMMPAILLLTIMLTTRLARALPRIAMMATLIIGGLFLMGKLLGGGMGKLVGYISEVTGGYLSGDLTDNLVTAFQTTWVGLGSGMATGPARVAFNSAEEAAANAAGIESFYAKAVYELGLVGLVIVAGLLLSLLWRGFKAFRRLKDPELRLCAGSILAFLIGIMVYLLKGAVIDYDPMNVYFWLLAGLLLRLPSIDLSGLPNSPGRAQNVSVPEISQKAAVAP